MKISLIIVIIVSLFTSGALANYGYKKNAMLKSTQANLASTTIAYEQKLEALAKEKEATETVLAQEKNKNGVFAEQIETINNTVGSLEKLKRIDKELLQKYSKVFFLNEHYVPKSLSLIGKQYVLPEKFPQEFHSNALPFLEDMFNSAKRDGIELRVVSAYRSFSNQGSLKSAYSVIYGKGTANQFSADQGYSEHQLGTTMDLSTHALGLNYEKIESDPGFQWLVDHAYLFGFVLSYPKNNTYYVYEPWHWRFVGVDLARDLHRDGKYFYDLDQRTIDSYLIKLFD
jgi:LAS superfamily LD-carboxypeptidase LdcB